MRSAFLVALAAIFLNASSDQSIADGPADNRVESVRPIPPPGIEVATEVIESLTLRCQNIRQQWMELVKQSVKAEHTNHLKAFASEVLVMPRAVEMAIKWNQFYHERETQWADQLLNEAVRRIEVIGRGGDWFEVMGLEGIESQREVIGGYRSKIDGSFQPYSLVIPKGLGRDDLRPRRLDIWFHGRGEKQSEVAFLAKQSAMNGQFNSGQSFTPDDTIVLHPYGRYCNAFRFAGEIDVLEVLEYVRSRLPVDPSRISVRGFSMGGAACWQFATRYADRWFAANPGAGFSETAEFLRTFQGENVRETMPAFQQTLWQLYDGPPLVINLTNCPLVAYSGEIDRQKQAADEMEAAMKAVDVDMIHVIGRGTAHSIHPDSKTEIERRMNSLSRHADSKTPRRVQFATPTLRYHQMHWVDVQGLIEHWKIAEIDAILTDDETVNVCTTNVSRLTLDFDSGQWPGASTGSVQIVIDEQTLHGPIVRSDRSWAVHLRNEDGQWSVVDGFDENTLAKRPGLQGPIDDALMDSFVFVLPSKASSDPVVQEWIETESQHAMTHWQKHYRGDVRAISDEDVDADILKRNHLILFGDYQSNSLIAQTIDRLPVDWDAKYITMGNVSVPSRGHVAAMIYPNPLAPKRYIVLNSGFTFREYDYLNNARQTPKLPDWALIDVRNGATTQLPGVLSAVGFFDESWHPRGLSSKAD